MINNIKLQEYSPAAKKKKKIPSLESAEFLPSVLKDS